MASKQETSEAIARLVDWLKPATRKRNGKPVASVLFVVSYGRGNASGLPASVDVSMIEGGIITGWLSGAIGAATGIRFDRKREALHLGGYGYSRSTHVASELARLMGKPIHCQTIGECFGASGWVK